MKTDILNKIRKQLSKQKAILAKRLNNAPVTEKRRSRRAGFRNRFNRKVQHKLLFALAEQQMGAVDDAIERLDEGNYGVCVDCGKPIEPNRLEALPTVTCCWDCHQTK